ncbi:MAG: FAD-dependent oxidoreductase [Planctomycetaceae bacterium]|nr:MAG: FAD-dependent oxidoreductase [Planctomycetaceae bacterium]
MQTNGPTNRSQPTVAVVGAGISGLTCARTLADHGLPVTVFEKSRGVGGRMATRRHDNGAVFDHGAQYFTVRDQRFQNCVDSWQHAGLVQRWTGRIVSLHDHNTEQDKSSTARFVACPVMNAICRHLAENLDVRTNTRVAPPSRCQGKWLVSDETGSELGEFDLVIVSAPGPQAGELLRGSAHLARLASSVKIAGCWALLVHFHARIDVDFDGAFVQDSPLSWIARNSSKPGRNPDTETWILHASGDWTQSHLEQPPEAIHERLLDAFWDATGVGAVPPSYVVAHRWRYALPTEPLPDRYLFDGDLQIGACGDWCSGPRVEGAFLSGAAMAGRVLASMDHVDCEV